MKVADIAFAAGFSSVRQFNETIGEVFAMTPSALRATARHHRSAGSSAESSTALTLNLPYREPFDPGVFDFLAVRAVPGIEEGSVHVPTPGPCGWPTATRGSGWTTTPAPRAVRWC